MDEQLIALGLAALALEDARAGYAAALRLPVDIPQEGRYGFRRVCLAADAAQVDVFRAEAAYREAVAAARGAARLSPSELPGASHAAA